MRYILITFILIALFILPGSGYLYAQDEEEIINYFQMEPLDDSLFIQIQTELFIDPPDPKAEIIADLRDANNQTVSIKGALYPFLALSPGIRARIITYPFKINLEESIHYGSVFTRVLERLRVSKILDPPSLFQISPTLGYINPFVQFQGGERFGYSLKKDVGLSFGFGTPYSGVLESNFAEFNFHILGFYGGFITGVDAMTQQKDVNNHNNLFMTEAYHFGYVVPFGNFFEVGFLKTTKKFSLSQIQDYTHDSVNKDAIVLNPDSSIKYQPYLVDGEFFNWEFRYPISVLGSTRGKVYFGQFLQEWHIGYTGRELSLAGSTFDFRFDAMFNSPVRQNQFVADILVQKIFDYWSFSSVAMGPGVILSRVKDGGFGITSIFVNLRIKLGTSL